jgi:hypothetical protein
MSGLNFSTNLQPIFLGLKDPSELMPFFSACKGQKRGKKEGIMD